jgi:hypothetical protein
VTLSNLLPGFRQLRAPLAAGYLWLLFIYLVADLGDAHPTSGITKQIADLGDALSPVGVAAAAGFAAYLIGSFSTWVARELVQLLVRTINPKTGASQGGLSSRGFAALDDLLTPRVARGELRTLADAGRLAREILGELDLIKTRLLGRDPELHGEIDRLHAEAEFRFALLLPLTAVAIVAVLGIPIPGDFGDVADIPMVSGVVILVEVFAFQAIGVWRQANDKLLDAVFLERVESPALERWDRDNATS